MTKSKGSSTCTILMLDKTTGRLFTSYIGDSLYLIARYNITGYELLFRSQEQMHDFSTPFQVGHGCDDPSQAILQSIDLRNNDIIILASDG
jgi:hypothetical protein